MQEKLMGLWAKVVENKAIVIRVGGTVVGALAGAVVGAILANAQEEAESQFMPPLSWIDELDGGDAADTIAVEE